MTTGDLTGVVLAGGYSSRYGSNKALATYNGLTMTEHAVAALRRICRTVVISGDQQIYSRFGLRVVPDTTPHLGPVGGIASVLASITSAKAIITACDMPLITPGILRPLACAEAEAAVWKDSDGSVFIFPMMINRLKGHDAAMRLLSSGSRSVRALLRLLSVMELPLDNSLRRHMSNINSPSDTPQQS